MAFTKEMSKENKRIKAAAREIIAAYRYDFLQEAASFDDIEFRSSYLMEHGPILGALLKKKFPQVAAERVTRHLYGVMRVMRLEYATRKAAAEISDELHVVIDEAEAKGEIAIGRDMYGLYVKIPSIHPDPVLLIDMFYGRAGPPPGNASYRLAIWSPTEGEDLVASVEFFPDGTVLVLGEAEEEEGGRQFRLPKKEA